MNGGWIAYDKLLPHKPQIGTMMQRLTATDRKLSRGDVVLACMTVWSWADNMTADGNVLDACLEDLDYQSRVEGFGEAMLVVGWVEVTQDGLRFPKWEKFNKESAKARLMRNRRQARWRTKRVRTAPPNVDGAASTSVDGKASTDVDGTASTDVDGTASTDVDARP